MLTLDTSKKSEEVLNQNMWLQIENRNLYKQLETLKDEIRKNKIEYETQINMVSSFREKFQLLSLIWDSFWFDY